MKRVAIWAATAAITGIGLAGCNKNDQANNGSTNPPGAVQTAADKTGTALDNAAHATGQAISNATTRASEMAQRAGASMGATTRGSTALAPDAGAMLSTVDSLVGDALTKSDFGTLIKNFTSAGQKQLGDYSKIDSTEMDGIIAQIRGDWKTKYGQDFKLPVDVLTNPEFAVSQGSTLNDNLTMPGNITNTGNPANVANGNVNRTAGTISISARDNLPDMLISMQNDGLIHGWRIMPPAALTAQNLHDNLLKQLTAVKNAQASWPADQNAAYRVVTEHILAAVANKTPQ